MSHEVIALNIRCCKYIKVLKGDDNCLWYIFISKTPAFCDNTLESLALYVSGGGSIGVIITL